MMNKDIAFICAFLWTGCITLGLLNHKVILIIISILFGILFVLFQTRINEV